MQLHFKLLSGEELDFIINERSCVIGRSSKCTVVIPHEGISRQHCQVEVDNGEVFVTDLGSTNGVIIDGQKIEPGKRTPYLTYLNLSFGPIQSLAVQLDETLSRPSKNYESQALTGHHSNKTKTVKLDLDERNRTRNKIQKKIKTKEEPKVFSANFILSIIMAAAILFGAIYYYASKDPEALPMEDTYDTGEVLPEGF